MNLEWIPIKTRPLTEEEKNIDWVIDCCVDYMYDCELPDDGDEVLITTKWGTVATDIFHNDCDGAYFEKFEEDIVAWAFLPEPYKDLGLIE